MPQAARKVLEMTRRQSEVAVAELVRVISGDQGLTTKVLRTCNSPYFGLRSRVSTLTQAVVLTGVRTVRSLVLLNSLPVHRKGPPSFEQTAMWAHSVAAALAARYLASELGDEDPEEAFLAGLLHDVGKLILSMSLGEKYEPPFLAMYNREGGSVEIERAAFGFDHAEVGLQVIRRWNFPDRMVSAVGNHHADPASLSGLDLLVRAADELVSHMGVGFRNPLEGSPAGDGLRRLGLEGGPLDAIRERVWASLDQETEMFKGAA
jgi:putative nucleotidyltransferase with HDIG domain